MYIYYSIGNNSGPWTLVRIVEVSVIGGVRFRRFHCIQFSSNQLQSLTVKSSVIAHHLLSILSLPPFFPSPL